MPSAKVSTEAELAPPETFKMQPPTSAFSRARAESIKPKMLNLTDGHQLEFFTDGDASKPAVFLIHGQWQTGAFWIGWPREDLFLVMPTRPNYGGSSKHAAYSYDSFAEDVRQLADHLKIEQFHVLGGSSGGPCAIAVKACLKDRVRRCVLISSDTENATLVGRSSQADLACCAPNKCCGCCLPCCASCCLVPMLKSLMNTDNFWKKMEAGKGKGVGVTPAEVEAWLALGKEKLEWGIDNMQAVLSAGAAGTHER